MDFDFKGFFRKYLISLGEDPDREGLKKTPQRVEDAYNFLFKGYNQKVEDVINGALFESEASEMIIVKNIELYSMCEHHMLPFFGKCHIGYVPDDKFIGLSKVARIVDVFARRLQIQERLTKEIGETIMKYTNAKGVGIVIEAQHLCMMMRGVEKQNSIMTTSFMGGVFRRDPRTRAEFMSLIDK
ncbi:MAG: GTP cyclohydrolase I FolE [Promethearchaeota archaeon]